MSHGIASGAALLLFVATAGCADPSAAEAAPPALPAEVAKTAQADFADGLRDWILAEGTWVVRRIGDDRVLAQTAVDRVYPLALWATNRYRDLDLSVRFRPLSGAVDASGGLVFRARDAWHYYLARANALEDNLRLYVVSAGVRRQIASVQVDPPALGRWHTLRVAAAGTRIRVDLDGRQLIDHVDATYASGHVGLWTKADSVTEFTDLHVTGTSVAEP
jgi:hypothetical protein